MEMADSSLNFTAQFYVESYLYRIDAIDEANTRIYNALNKNGIEIPFPQIDVNLKKT
jgi:small-conductance mechanosensitive channel